MARSVRDELGELVLGQAEAVHTVSNFVDTFRAGLHPEGRPVASIMLAGPTGTGKTRIVEALSEVLHGSKHNVMRVDCAEFQLDHDIARMIGSPPGYVGHDTVAPLFTCESISALRSVRCPLSIILFDELEKASDAVMRILLGILDKGVLHTHKNTGVSFEESIIFMTTNEGAMEADARPIGIQSGRAAVGIPGTKALRRRFSPEFLNRLDATIQFNKLTRDVIDSIFDQLLLDLQLHLMTRLSDRAFAVTITPAAREALVNEGVSDRYGARELRRVIQKRVLHELVPRVMNNEIERGSEVTFDYVDGKYDIKAEKATLELLLTVTNATMAERNRRNAA